MKRRNFISIIGSTLFVSSVKYTNQNSNDLYIALHWLDPFNDQKIDSEVKYEGYERIIVDRTNWTKDNNGGTTNSKTIDFPVARLRNPNQIRFCSIQKHDGTIIKSAPLKYTLSVSYGIQPRFPVGSLQIPSEILS